MMPSSLATERLIGVNDGCSVTISIVVERPWRPNGGAQFEEDRAATLAVTGRIANVLQASFGTLISSDPARALSAYGTE